MTRSNFALLSCLWSVCVLESAFAQDETTGTIRGSVEDNSTKQNRIDDVRVVMVDLNGNQYETVTNDYGDYVITGVSPGRYLMSLYKDGYETLKDKQVTAIAGGDTYVPMNYVPMKMTKKEPSSLFTPWLLYIFLGAVVPIIGIVVAVATRTDRSPD